MKHLPSGKQDYCVALSRGYVNGLSSLLLCYKSKIMHTQTQLVQNATLLKIKPKSKVFISFPFSCGNLNMLHFLNIISCFKTRSACIHIIHSSR